MNAVAKTRPLAQPRGERVERGSNGRTGGDDGRVMMMSERRESGPLVPLAGMFENTSQRTGAVYFVGYLGKAKLVMLKAKDAKEGEPAWTLFVQERPARPQTGSEGGR